MPLTPDPHEKALAAGATANQGIKSNHPVRKQDFNMDDSKTPRPTDSVLRHLVWMIASFEGVTHPLALGAEGWVAGIRRNYHGNIDVIGLLDPVFGELRELSPVLAWERLIAELDRLEVERVAKLPIKFTAAEIVAHAERMGRQASEVLAELDVPVRCVFCGRELGADPLVVDRDEATGHVDHACSDLSGCNDALPESGERS